MDGKLFLLIMVFKFYCNMIWIYNINNIGYFGFYSEIKNLIFVKNISVKKYFGVFIIVLKMSEK